MKLKIVLAAVAGRDADPSTLDVDSVVARRFGAHIEALHIRSDPRDAIPFLGEGASGVLIEQIMTAAERDSGSRSGKARQAFEAWRSTTGFATAGAPGATGSTPRAPIFDTNAGDATILDAARPSTSCTARGVPAGAAGDVFRSWRISGEPLATWPESLSTVAGSGRHDMLLLAYPDATGFGLAQLEHGGAGVAGAHGR